MRILGIDLSDGDLWLLGLFGACLALLVPHRLAVSRDSRARTAQAVGGFRVAFNTDIAEIANSSRIPDNLVYVHLARRFPVHAVAVSEFGHHLGFFARRRLAEDWSAYANTVDEIRQRYDALSGTPEAEARRKLAVERLQSIVSHGSET